MIVVEDRDKGEIIRFFLVDAHVNLGCIQAGKLEQEFGPDRLLRYYNHLENRIYEYAARYPESFSYLPRRAYRYLMEPDIFKTIRIDTMGQIQYSWLADQFVGTALSSVSSKKLEKKQSLENAQRMQNIARSSTLSTRLYYFRELGLTSKPGEAWGLILNAPLLDNLDNIARRVLNNAIQMHLPIGVRLNQQDEIIQLVDWLISVKERGLEAPRLLIMPNSLRSFDENLLRLLDIPNTNLVTTNASISSLSSVISALKKKHPKDWAKRLIFGSGYPETQRGDSLSEILCFLLSKNLNLHHRELQLILGGNMLRLLPGRPPFLSFIETKTRVQAVQQLGKVASGELSRVFRVIGRKHMRDFCSCDMLIADDGAFVPTNQAFLSITKPNENTATGLGIILDQEESLALYGWNDKISSKIDSRDARAFLRAIDASLATESKTLTDINELQVLTDSVLDSLRIEADEDVVSSLRYILGIGDEKGGNISLNSEDMTALNLNEGEIIIVLESDSRRWWGAKAFSHGQLDKRHISTSKEFAAFLNLEEEAMVDVLKYSREMQYPSEVIMKYDAHPQSISPILPSFFHLHESDIDDALRKVYVGEGTDYKLVIGSRHIHLELQTTRPELETGQLCDLMQAYTRYVPKCLMEEFNLVICLETSEKMAVKKIAMDSPIALRTRLSERRHLFDDLENLKERIQEQTSMSDASIAAILILLNSMVENRTPGRFSFLTYDERIRKFSIQKGHDLDTSIGFRTEFSTKEVRDSLFYSVIDSAQEMIGVSKPEMVHRAIAESLEDFGSDRPTLVLVFTTRWNQDAENSVPFLKAISKRDNYQVDVILPYQNESTVSDSDNLNISFHSIERFSLLEFDKYILNTVGKLLQKDR
jgi:hypothetical protein